jgi:4-hydroxy-tetrahydrodipicolinate synthase
VFTIPSTPFDKNGDIDWGDLKQVIDFCVACGAHGIVWPVNASGFPVLTDEERLQGMRVVIEQTAGRIPVVLGVQGVSGHHATMFSRRAQELRADGVIAMAPYVQELEDEGAVMHYYQAIERSGGTHFYSESRTR